MNNTMQLQSPRARYTLDHEGHHLEIEATADKLTNTARLFVDGQQVDEQQASLADRSYLRWNDLTVMVQWGWWSGQVAKCVLVEESTTSDGEAESDETLFVPPPGTRTARMAQFQRDHPTLYATRHVVLAVVQVVLPLLGISALLSAFLPNIDLPWLADIGAFLRTVREQIDVWIPDIYLPFPNLRAVIKSIVDSAFFKSITWVWGRIKWVLPIIIAILVAIKEIQRHKHKQQHDKQ